MPFTLGLHKHQYIINTRKHSSRMPTICASIASKCQQCRGSPQVNKFEKVSSDGHQMPLAGRSLSSEVPWGQNFGSETRTSVGLYSEVQCIMGNDHMDHPCEWTE